MDEFENKLMNAARELAAVSQSRLQVTTAEIGELEEQLGQLKAQRDGQLDAQGRLGGAKEYRCPNCWIRDRQSILLKSIPFERPEQDVMRCPACGLDFGICFERKHTSNRFGLHSEALEFLEGGLRGEKLKTRA